MIIRESSQWLGKNIVRCTGIKDSRKALIGALAAAINLKKMLKTTLTHSHTMTHFDVPGKQAF